MSVHVALPGISTAVPSAEEFDALAAAVAALEQRVLALEPIPEPIPPPAPRLIPAVGSAIVSQQHNGGPADWIDVSQLPAPIPWSVFADANQTLAPSQKGIWASSWKKIHVWGNTSGLYHTIPRILDGRHALSNPQAGTDDPVWIVRRIESYQHPRPGPRGVNIISPYTTWHGHTRVKDDGTLGSPRAPLYVGIRMDGLVTFAFRDGAITDAAKIPGVDISYDFSFNPPDRQIFYVADWQLGRIVKVDRSQAGSPEDATKWLYSDHITGLIKPTSIRVLDDGSMYVAANGQLLRIANGIATPLSTPPGVFWLDYTSGNQLVAMTLDTGVYIIDPATNAIGPNLLPTGAGRAAFVQCSVDRKGTFGPVDDIYAIRDLGSSSGGGNNVNMWRIHGAIVNAYYGIVPTGNGKCTVGNTTNCIDLWGHYMWVVECHPDEALLLTQGFADSYPAVIRPALPTDAPEDVYNHALFTMGQAVLLAGGLKSDAQPSFTAQMSALGWSLLGVTPDYIAQMAFADAAAFIQKGGIGSFPRPDITDYYLYAVLYFLYRSSQRFLREGKSLMDALKTWIGPVTVTTAGPAFPAASTTTFLHAVVKSDGSIAHELRDQYQNLVTNTDALMVEVIADKGMSGAKIVTRTSDLTPGPHALTCSVLSGATRFYRNRTQIITV